MKNIKEHIEKHIDKHGAVTVYSPESIALNISKAPYLSADGKNSLSFEMDCIDLADYCNALGLTIHPTNKI